MRSRCGVVIAVLLAGTLPAVGGSPVPDYLPKYRLALDIDPAGRVAQFRQVVTWTNPARTPTRQLVFNFSPHYKIPPADELLLSKTLELLRLPASSGISYDGPHGMIAGVTADGAGLKFDWRPGNNTGLVIDLPTEVRGGGSVTVELAGSVRLPNKQGRWGHWQGVTYLTNALPVVAFYDDAGWHDVPFVPWHQPFWNEAGVYTAAVTLPEAEQLACSADVERVQPTADGRKRVTLKPFIGRDFAVVCSVRFHEHSETVRLDGGKVVRLRCLALPHHDYYAREILRIAAAAIPVYSRWFGDFPYEHFTLVESFFGWNGNECGGLVMVDERVFDMPKLAVGYVEYLVSHETCHQWWYNQVGTNGYSETFMDEGAATYFTHRLLDARRGKNNEFLHWPEGLEFLPNIKRENYRFASFTGAIRKDQVPAAAGDLPEFGHLYGLFSGAYDRGSKVFHLIEGRLGEAAFLDFVRELVTRYSFRQLSAAQLKAELVAYSGPQSQAEWDELFARWVYGKGLTDWRIDGVTVAQSAGPRVGNGGGVRVEVTVSQVREYDEATVVGFQFADGDGFPVRVPVGGGPAAGRGGAAGADAEVVRRGDKTVIRVTLPRTPTQVTVDPDRVLLDADPGNNSWKPGVNVRAVPFYSFLYDTDLTNDYDRWNVTAGPWYYGALYPDPWYTRSSLVGARVGAYRTQRFAGGVYAAYRTDYRDLVVGADGLLDHWPGPRTQVGFNVEQRVGGPYFSTNGQQTATRAVLFGRYVLQYGSSLYLPPISYVDAYTTYQDNFLPNARTGGSPGAVRPGGTWLTGAHYRLNLLTPYWDPERGVWLDAAASGGTAQVNGTTGAGQFKAEVATTQKLPDGYGYWSDVKVAGRVLVQGALPAKGQFFALGGSTVFRGFDLAERQGSALWVANVEARLPIVKDVRWDVADHLAGVRGLSVAAFYDVGDIYADRKSVGGVAHAVGGGLRADLAFFSFIERATVRLDVGKTLNAASPFQFWFGVQQPF